ncbi:HINT domain-containing protein [Paenibacillus hunanensis]|nr:HINT domain-containing protein [Paenibacillus hunanensis]
MGDLLVKEDGSTLEIKEIQHEKRQARVYNMTVADFHTYFVSDLGIWVHNTNDNCDINSVGRVISELNHPVLDNTRVGSALKNDFYHNFNNIIDNYVMEAQRFDLPNKKGHLDSLYQIEGSIVKYENGYVKAKNNAPEMVQNKRIIDGVFEWVVDPAANTVPHRTFIPGGKVTGKINQWGK